MALEHSYYTIPEDPADLAAPESFSLELSKQSLQHTERDLWYVIQENPELSTLCQTVAEDPALISLLLTSPHIPPIAEILELPVITTTLLVLDAHLQHVQGKHENQREALDMAFEHILKKSPTHKYK